MVARNASLTSTGGRRHSIDASTLGVTSVLNRTHEKAVVDHAVDADEEVLTALGYKQESVYSSVATHDQHTHDTQRVLTSTVRYQV